MPGSTHKARTSASVYFHFFANSYAAGRELGALVLEKNLEAIMGQMKGDPALVGQLQR